MSGRYIKHRRRRFDGAPGRRHRKCSDLKSWLRQTASRRRSAGTISIDDLNLLTASGDGMIYDVMSNVPEQVGRK
jgi:hypothetical protein